MRIGLACGCPATTVWHGFQTLLEMKTAEKTQVSYSIFALSFDYALKDNTLWLKQVIWQI